MTRQGTIVGLIMATLARKVMADGFLYPDATVLMSFHIGDNVDVSWVSSYDHPTLKLFCGYQENREYEGKSYNVN